jgi:hypothetical protein
MKPQNKGPRTLGEFEDYLERWKQARGLRAVPPAGPRETLEEYSEDKDKRAYRERESPDIESEQEQLFIRNVISLIQRHSFREDVLSSDDKFADYIKAHPRRDRIVSSIRRELRMRHTTVGGERAVDPAKMKDDDLLQTFRQAATKAYYQVPELPAVNPPTLTVDDLLCLCERWTSRLKDTQREAKLTDEQLLVMTALLRGLEEAAVFVEATWRELTGTPYSFNAQPDLGTLTSRIAGLPVYLNWDYKSYKSEHSLMQRQVDPSINQTSGDGKENDSHLSRSESEAETPGGPCISGGCEGLEVEGESVDSESRKEAARGNNSVDPLIRCSFQKVKELASNFPEAPTGPDDPMYTFPHKLGKREDIFYDYSVILPVKEVLMGKPQDDFKRTRYRAAIIVIDKAKAVLTHLRQTHLDVLLGQSVAASLHDDLHRIQNRLEAGYMTGTLNDASIGEFRETMREWSGIMRLLARTEMFLIESGAGSVTENLTELEEALRNAPVPSTIKSSVPVYDPSTAPLKEDLLRLTDDSGGHAPLPVDDIAIPGAALLPFPARLQTYLLRPSTNAAGAYLRYLGGTFYEAYRRLLDASNAVAIGLAGFQGGYEEFRREFARMAGEIVNHAASSLADLLEEVADNLITPPLRPYESRKRLALQLVYRQYWMPAGYVQGKLIGYKTLIPGETQKVTRRTIVKTTTELTTASEFVATRSEDYTTTQRETAEVTKELAKSFNFTTSASGKFDFAIGGVEASTSLGLNLSETSKASHSLLGESVMKGSVAFNEKREVKIREIMEREDVTEVTNQLINENKEITANYFYYQLLRNYRVLTSLQAMRPVLLRARNVPSTAEIDYRFVSKYIHILANILPAQLSIDAQETVDRMQSLSENTIRRRAEMDRAAADYEVFVNEGPPAEDAESKAKWNDQVREKQARVDESRDAYYATKDEYEYAATRINRVCDHVRDNIKYYMQYIWQNTPGIDYDDRIRQEYFQDRLLPEVTRGLSRIGYQGQEEIYEYTGQALRMTQIILSHTLDGAEIAALPDDDPIKSALMEYLRHYYGEDDDAILLARMAHHHFLRDPVNPEEVFSKRYVQVAQDAVVVETMPGQVPLLEGFQLAHRILDVQQSCLENLHLAQRIKDRPWMKDSSADGYDVRRYEGSVPPQREVHE